MGDISPSPSQQISISSPHAAASMSSSNFQQPDQQLKTPESETLIQETSVPDSNTAESPAEKDSERSIENRDGDEEGEEEEGECGFCLFMKGGGCKETFIEWEKCVEESEKKNEDIVEKCFQATTALKKCMETHSDYYSPILQAEKAAQAEAAKHLGEEKERSNKIDKEGGGQELEKKEVTSSGSDLKK
ncbi:hypothetical protein ACS0TY_009848 [Phlomoides rotata]